MSSLSSPCVKLCIIDPPSGLCQGCGRTLDEIARWALLSEAERQATMAVLPARLDASRRARRAAAGRTGGRRRTGPVGPIEAA